MASTESERIQQLVKWEAGPDTYFARDSWIVTNTKVVVLGDILKGTSAGCERATDAADITAIALDDITGDGATKIPVLVRDAVVDNALVNYQSLNETTCKATLKALGILVRTGPTYTTL